MPLTPPADRALLGTAFDYRARYFLGFSPEASTVAQRGARALASLMPREPAAKLAPAFFETLSQTVTALRPAYRRLPLRAERRLARFCSVLAMYESIFRAGPGIGTPLFSLHRRATVEDLVRLPSRAVLTDLVGLASDFEEDAAFLLTGTVVLNPSFEGSPDVGGADADFIAGPSLYELKLATTFRWHETIRQLLAYCLLDYSDHFHIRTIGVLLPWHRRRLEYPIASFILPPEELLAGSPDPRRIEERLLEIRTNLKAELNARAEERTLRRLGVLVSTNE